MGLHKLEANSHNVSTLQRWSLPLFLVAVSLALLSGGDATRELMRYERSGIENGEFWRLLTGHLVHLGASHFALNAAGLALVWYLVGDAFTRIGWAWVALASIIAIDSGFWLLNPGLRWYVGLSGLLHGLLAAGLVVSATKERKEIVLLAILLVAKLAWEQLGGPLPGSESSSGGPVVVDAHLYGAVGGLFAAFLAKIRVRAAATI